MRKISEISIRVTKEMKARLVAEAVERGESEAFIVRDALREYFEEKDEAQFPSQVSPLRSRAELNERPPLPTKPLKR